MKTADHVPQKTGGSPTMTTGQEMQARPDARQARPDAGPSLHDQWASLGRRARGHRPRSDGAFQRRALVTISAVVLLLMGAGVLAGVLTRVGAHYAGNAQVGRIRAPSAPKRYDAQISASDTALMSVARVDRGARDFTLTDQYGRRVSLLGLARRHAIVLGFMNDEGTDMTPILAREFVDAYHDLGASAASVDFVAVNVDAASFGVGSLRAFFAGQGHGLGSLPDFYYLTGSEPALKPVWARFGVKVLVRQTGGVVHSDKLYFLSRGGRIRFRATPFADLRANGTGWLPAKTVSQWGRGIALYAKTTLGK